MSLRFRRGPRWPMPYPQDSEAGQWKQGQRHPSAGHLRPALPWLHHRLYDWSDGPDGSHHYPYRANRRESGCRCESSQWLRQKEQPFSSPLRTNGRTQRQKWDAAAFRLQEDYTSWNQTGFSEAQSQNGCSSVPDNLQCIPGIPGSVHCSSVNASSTGLPSGAVMIFFT